MYVCKLRGVQEMPVLGGISYYQAFGITLYNNSILPVIAH